MLEIEQGPGRGVEARAEHFFVERVVGGSGHRGSEVHVELELVEVHHAVDVMDVVVEELLGGIDRQDGFERGRMTHGHLDGVEASPGNAEHSHFAGGPGLSGQPGDDLFSVELFLLGIFAVGGRAFARAEASDIDADADVSAGGEPGVDRIVAGGGGVVFAVGEIFEEGGEFLAGLGVAGHVESGGEVDAVGHGDRLLDHADGAQSGRRRFRGRERVERRGNREQSEDRQSYRETRAVVATVSCRASLGWTAEGGRPYARASSPVPARSDTNFATWARKS